ncbi:uncharacterized vancomycin resistance protein [Sanguibacter keddieii DSM 10542]|uniref:Uncharacterized vancomycin resistance protein n=1 Tax=Sanguibacter keddieii (strain ATCC 51767 / DSM 10542 / NCFB 3025 / ST-74) TaxID=446469 RepID=D1BKN3_SANKS|nr:VanW family protein [Sanguibacter keddieii]ACZ22510.1 uncharacterized vancomycin resistance protein [Sanguibacter keddieii DSM 10542]
MSSSPDGTSAASGPPTGPTPQNPDEVTTQAPGYPVLNRPPVEDRATSDEATVDEATVDDSSEVDADAELSEGDEAVAVDPVADEHTTDDDTPSVETAPDETRSADDDDFDEADDESDDDTVVIRSGDRTEVISPVPLAADGADPGAEPATTTTSTSAPTDATTSPSTPSTASSSAADAAGPAAGDSVLDDFDRTEPARRWPRNLLWAGCAVLVLAGAYVAAQWYFADRIPRETTVAGIDIGGLSNDAAVERLESELGGIAAAPLPVTAGEATTTVDPAAAGLTFDAEATVDGLTSFSLAPSRLLAQISGGDAVAPVSVIDDAALAAAVETMGLDLEVEATSGTVGFVDGAAVATEAVEGSGADLEESTELIRDTWLTATRPLVLPTEPIEPDINQAETDEAYAVAQTVASAPVTVAVADQVAEIPVDVMTAAASMAPVDGALQLTFDGELLVQDVVARTTDLLSDAADAKFVFVDGAPQIEAGLPGTTLDPEALAAAVQTAATGEDRTAPVELVESDPAQSTEALEALGVTEIVSQFATPLTNEPVRTENLRVAAERVTGTLVLPGEEFDLTQVIGPITAANGYQAAHIISNGQIVDGIGGGLSQMSTTTYNVGFFAGMVDLEHRPHSYWFDRYPEGRESTLAVGQINMRWRNDSPYGVLMQSYIADGKLHVVAWSTPYYTVTDSTSSRSDVVAATVEHKSGPGCVAQSRGNSGFSVSISRTVTITATGEKVIDETNSWRYRPQNGVVCDAPPPAEPEAPDASEG